MRFILSLAFLLFGLTATQAEHFKVGFAQQNITPATAMPMWGYGDRHNALRLVFAIHCLPRPSSSMSEPRNLRSSVSI